MSKGGGGGGSAPPVAPTSSTVTQTNLPEYAEPYYTRLMERGEEESNVPYQPYPAQRLTEFGPDTMAGFEGIRDVSQAGTPAAFTAAESALTGVAGSAPLAQQEQFGTVGSYADPGEAEKYMNPYIGNVLDVQKERLNQRFAEQQLLRDEAARQQSSFSNTRRPVGDELARAELNQQLNEMTQRGLAGAYESGASIYANERADELRNRELNARVFAENQQRMLDQYGRQTGAAEQLRAQGMAGDELAYNRAKTLAGVGGVLEDREQQALDIAYSDFINQRDFPRSQLNYYSGILRGVPVSAQQETRQYDAPPSQVSQLLGLGIGGLGLAKAFG